MSTKPKGLADFEQTFGQPKIRRLEREVANQHAKIANLVKKTSKAVTVHKVAGNTVKFGLFGDTHIGSMECFSDGLKAFYDRCADENCKTMLCTGDILDGNRMYRGQEFELRDVGLTAQLERFELEAPDTIETQFITGNHDASFAAQVGVDVGAALAEKKKAWVCLGEDQATVRFNTDDGVFDVCLLHPSGGTAYALSYRPQKIVEQMEGGTKPNLIAIGHFHKAEFIPSYRNIAVVQTGTFEWQTPYMMRKGLAAHVGGWIVEATVGESWNIVKAEFLAFYR